MSDTLIIALATLVASLVTPLLTLWVKAKLEKLHLQINSRMDEFLKSQKDLGHAEGKVEGKAEEKQEQKGRKK